MPRRVRASAAPSPTASGPARTVQRVDHEAWQLARLYADGDVTRLRVLDDRTVLVLNRPAA